MFIDFFYEVKKEGIPVSLNEWLTLMEALGKDLAFSSLTGFYYLARAILVKSEVNFDRYDTVFSRYFKGIETQEDLLAEAIAWLEDPNLPKVMLPNKSYEISLYNLEELRNALSEKLKGLEEKHTEGPYEVGSGGNSPFGSNGVNPQGVRIGGQSAGLTAIKVAAKRKYRDYRDDRLTGTRQFEMALRRLRQLSSRVEGPRDELDIEATVDETGRNAGLLNLVWERPRRNLFKVIVLMDSAGSIDRYHDLCSRLFMAAHKSNHFKEIKFYYFHNCVYDNIYKNHMIDRNNAIKTEDFMRTKNSDYRLIIVGDAAMSPSELTMAGGAISWDEFNNETGETWLRRLARHFPYSAWLNPVPSEWWGREPDFTTVTMVRDIFPMFELNPKGLEQAIKKIRVKSI